MSFHNAPVTKGVMLFLGISSLTAAIFDVKHYFHIQLVPHIARDHQYWRLLTHHLIFGNSSELLLAMVLLFNVGVNIERTFSSRKYGSFLIISGLLSTLLTFSTLLLTNRFGLNYLPPAPVAIIFAIMYQHYRIVPISYTFRISVFSISNKAFQYFLAYLLAISDPPGTLVTCAIGLITGQIYRSDIVNLKNYRISPRIERLCRRFLLPLIGSTKPPRYSNRALPNAFAPNTAYRRDQTASPANPPQDLDGNVAASATGDGIATTATMTTTSTGGDVADATRTSRRQPSAMSEWVDELTGRRGGQGLRLPTDEEISTLTGMFPALPREQVVSALQRSQDIQAAADSLLSHLPE
ncbi:hypothetical protein FRB94_000156 [Tulasnella sp. JGI-2019a]|nr:hypothetical protein FRB94_000156 [Tulasnella sp. JGI-2019a]KAG9015839.1 hypothetical protein FRB93_012404 [Tulasnella sp. JGI-2019a]